MNPSALKLILSPAGDVWLKALMDGAGYCPLTGNARYDLIMLQRRGVVAKLNGWNGGHMYELTPLGRAIVSEWETE